MAKRKTKIERLRALASTGDAEAQYKLGNIFYEGQGIQRSFKKAASYFLKAALQRHTAAQCAIGCLYFYGERLAKKALAEL